MAIAPSIVVQVDAAVTKALADILAFSQAAQRSLDGIKGNIAFDRDKNDAEAEDGGGSAGKKWWSGFGKESEKGGNQQTSRFKRLFTKWAGIVAAFGETIGVALFGAAGALASVSASLVSAIGAAGAFIPIATAMGVAIGTIVIGSAGLKDGFSAVNEEMKTAVKEGRAFNAEATGIQEALVGLAPSAREFVLAFAGVREQFAVIQEFVQQRLFEGFGEALTDIAAKQLPAVQSALGGIASTLNTAFLDLFETIGSFNLGGLLSSWTPLISNVAGALAPLASAFLGFLSAATPAAITLSEQFAKWAENLAKFVEQNPDKIAEFLDRSLTSLNSWLDLIGSIGTAFGSFMEIAAGSGDSLVKSLTGVVDTFDDWINKNPDTILAFLETAETIVKALGPLLKGAVGFFDNLVSAGAVSRFEDLASTLGEILPILGSILEASGRANVLNIVADAILAIGEAIESSGLLETFGQLAEVLGEALGSVLTSIVDSGILVTLGEGLAGIGEVIIKFFDALINNEQLAQSFQDGLIAIGDALTAVGPSVLILLDAFISLIPVLTATLELLPVLADLIEILAPILEVFALAVAAVAAVVGGAFQEMVDFLIDFDETWVELWENIQDFLTDTLDAMVAGWQAFTDGIEAALKAFVDFFVGAWADYAAQLDEEWDGLWRRLTEAFSSFVGIFTGLWDDIKSAWDDTLVDLEDFRDDVVTLFTNLPAKVTSALSTLKDAIVKPFEDAWKKAKEYVDKIKDLPGTIAGGIGGAVSRVVPGLARGGILTGPTRILAGEAGTEAVIPLTRPLSQIDPSVRMMAALLRGEGPKSQGQQATTASVRPGLVNNWVINDMTGNAEATAQKVLNRLALV